MIPCSLCTQAVFLIEVDVEQKQQHTESSKNALTAVAAQELSCSWSFSSFLLGEPAVWPESNLLVR